MVAGTPSKENWGHWGGDDPKKEKNKLNAPALGWQRDGGEGRHLEPDGIRD